MLFYCKNIFSSLEVQKKTQHLSFGISQLENTVYTTNSATQSLRQDTRFLPFYYTNPDSSDLSIQTGTKLKNYLSSLLFPLSLVSDWGLTFSDKMAVTTTRFVSSLDASTYYQESFQIDDLTYEEWEALLQEYQTRFMPIHHVHTMKSDYDALIYSIPWGKNSYLYVCLNIRDVKSALVGKDELDSLYISLEDSDGLCLYTDLPGEISDYHSVTQKCSIGNLVITIHIPDAVLNKQMHPLYTFLLVYLTVCLIMSIGSAVISSRLSAKPVVKAFHSYEIDLQKCNTLIDTQTKVIQARYMEKAIHGSLATESDYDSFFSYFSNFPQHFCMILLGLIEKPAKNGTIYTNALSIIQHYLEQYAPYAYIQQLNKTKMLIIVDENICEEYTGFINQLMNNINQEEPCYHVWGIVSKAYSHPKSLPYAYRQMQDMLSQISPETIDRLCTVSDFSTGTKSVFQISDTLSIYSAITHGNAEVAILKLDSYLNQLNLLNHSVFEMFRSILQCIKQEYSDLLIDVEIPFYHAEIDLYSSLSNAILLFCNKFSAYKEENKSDSFAQQVKAYIDLHYAEESLCNTTLEKYFGCSYIKIRKAFVQETGTPISAYIEEKRMALANELLFHGQDSVSDVAAKCGYTSYNTFHKAYRRVFGHAPSDVKPNS